MMKKLLALLLALMMLFSVATVFAGCEDSDSKKSSSSDEDDEDKDDEDKDNEDKDDEDKDNEDKDNEDKDNEDKDDEDKDNEDKDNEDKDNEDKDNEDKDNEDKDDENQNSKPSVDDATKKNLQDVVSEALESYFGLADEINMDLAPDEVYEYVEYLYDYTKEDIRGGADAYFTYIYSMMESSVGANISLESEVTEIEKMTDAELVKVGDGMEFAYGDRLDNDAFTEGYFVVVDMALTGDDDDITKTEKNCAVVCYDGQWYFIYCEVDGDTFYCDFYFREVISAIMNILEYPEYYQ